MRNFKLRLFTILFFALSFSFYLLADNILFYKTISVNTNISGGSQNRELMQFSLNFQSTNLSEITVASLTYQLTSPATIPIGKIELYRNNQSVAIGLFDANNKAKLTFTTPDIIYSNTTNKYLIRANFFSTTGNGLAKQFNLSISNSDFNLYPNYPVNLSNLDAVNGNFPNTNGSFILYERTVAISNRSSLIPLAPSSERDNYIVMGAFSFQAENFPFTSQPISISKFQLDYNGTDIKDLQYYFVFLDDDGDNNFDPTIDPLISTTLNLQDTTDVYLESPIYLDSITAKLIWIIVKIAPTATLGNNIGLQLSDDSIKYYPTGLYITNHGVILNTAINSIVDNFPPLAVTGEEVKAGDQRVLLQWTNPTNLDAYGVRLTYKIGSAATGPTDGSFLDIIITNKIGSGMESIITNLTNGTEYYFTMYSFDCATNWSVVSSPLTATPHPVTNWPAIPQGVTISPFSDKYQISWIGSSEPEHYCYRIRTFTENNGQIHLSDKILTSEKTILKSDLGLLSTQPYPVVYFSVVNYDINETASSNDFSNNSEARERGIRISSTPIVKNSGKIYNTIFQPEFNEYARILVSLQNDSMVEIRIFSIAGRHIKTIVKTKLTAGEHEFRWYGNDSGSSTVTPGLYFVHIRFDKQIITKKVFLRR